MSASGNQLPVYAKMAATLTDANKMRLLKRILQIIKKRKR